MELDAMIQEYLEYGMSRQLRKKTLYSYEQVECYFNAVLSEERRPSSRRSLAALT